jgi:hypothetical protein
MRGMDEDDMTTEELHAAMLAGAPTTVNPGPAPILTIGPVRGVSLTSSRGGGGSMSQPRVSVQPTPALAAAG